MKWTRRKTWDDEDAAQDDWTVLLDGVPVGRVYFAIQLPKPKQWSWASWAQPCRIGAAETLDAALEDLRKCVLASSGALTDKTRLW